MAIITLASWDWFKRFDGTKLKKRGDEYDELKSALGDAMLEQACKYVLHLLLRASPPATKNFYRLLVTRLFPSVRRHVDYVEIGSPLTNKHYIAAPHGEIYGLDHDMVREGKRRRHETLQEKKSNVEFPRFASTLGCPPS